MPKNKDTRDLSYNAITDVSFSPENFAADFSETMPGDQGVEVGQINNFTGSPRTVQSINPPDAFDAVTETMPNNAALIDMALSHIESISPALGFTSGPKPDFVPDPAVKETSAGTRVVSLQQQYRGIPVSFMERTVIFNKDGAIVSVTGDNVDLTSDISTSPAVSLETAARVAAEYMATSSDEKDPWTGEPMTETEIDLTGYEPKVLGRINLTARPAILDKGPFAENIPAHLVLFYQGEKTRLCWHFIISTPNFEDQFVINVEADSQTGNIDQPEILYARNISHHMATNGKVWVHNPKMNPTRDLVDFPLGLAGYPIDSGSLTLPAGFPLDWVDAASLMTIGNCTIAVTGDTGISASGTNNNGILSFDPDDIDAQGDVQKVINIFYFCNYMHDFFYMLGFDEKHGNFQKINFTGLGAGTDPVIAHAHPGPVNGTANMLTRADGTNPVMNMGLVSGTNRHTAFDSDVVFHEFTHGVTNRLVGRQIDFHSLDEVQSRSMGEGWSDYFALTIQNCLALINDPAAVEKTVTGDWVTNRAAGIRLAAYDDNYPGTFGNLGTPPYNRDVHSIGEIWCAALMKMNRDFGTALGDRVRGHRIGWQIVVDALKQTPANPSFLDARDAILRSLDDLNSADLITAGDHILLKRAAWIAFARFGMGPNARSNGAFLGGIVEDRNPPANV